MSNVAYVREFTERGDFAASSAAESWCEEFGISVGRMQGPDPRGLLVGDFDIAKWRNLDAAERKALHGVMKGDQRNGPVRIELFTNCPLIEGVTA